MSYRQYRRARKLGMNAATMTMETVSRLMMERNVSACRAFPIPCCANGSHCCPPFGQTVGNGAAVPGGYEKRCAVRQTISSRFQPGKILQTLCGEGSPKAEKMPAAEKAAPYADN